MEPWIEALKVASPKSYSETFTDQVHGWMVCDSWPALVSISSDFASFESRTCFKSLRHNMQEANRLFCSSIAGKVLTSKLSDFQSGFQQPARIRRVFERLQDYSDFLCAILVIFEGITKGEA